MPKKRICADCGREMINLYGPRGIVFYVCPNIKSSLVNALGGKLKRAEIYCHAQDAKGIRMNFEKRLAKAMSDELCEVTNNNIGLKDLMMEANRALMFEIPASRLVQFFEAAVKLGMALGRHPEKSIGDLIYGVGEQRPRRLDNLGVVVDSQKARKKYPGLTSEEAWKKYAMDMVIEKAELE